MVAPGLVCTDRTVGSYQPSRYGSSTIKKVVALLYDDPGTLESQVFPDAEVPDDALEPGLARRRATELYPTDSLVTPEDTTLRVVFTQAAQRRFRSTLDQVDPRVGAKLPERLCMKFLTRGYACTDKDCPFPHVGNVETLTPSNKTKFCEAVKKQPGLSWAEGKAPAGTTS